MASFKAQYERFKAKKLRKLRQSATVLLAEQRNLVAEKTFELEDSLDQSPIRQDSPTRFTIEVGSFGGVEHASIVEFGVKGRVYNYHRYEGGSRAIVYVGVGQAWRARSLENTKGEIITILSS